MKEGRGVEGRTVGVWVWEEKERDARYEEGRSTAESDACLPSLEFPRSFSNHLLYALETMHAMSDARKLVYVFTMLQSGKATIGGGKRSRPLIGDLLEHMEVLYKLEKHLLVHLSGINPVLAEGVDWFTVMIECELNR